MRSDTFLSIRKLDFSSLKEKNVRTTVRQVDTDNSSSFTDGAQRPSRRRFSARSFAVLVIAVISVTLLIVWLSIYLPSDRESWWTSRAIGGRFTQGQAKAIDFITGALLTPILIAGLSFVWFASARIAMCIERGDSLRGTPLRALIEASCTSTGSYSLFKYKVLLTSKRLPMILIAVLALVVALTNSFLANVIAYEAIDVAWPGASANLSLLSDPLIEVKGGRSVQAGPSGLTYYNPYDFNTDQKADFANQVTGLWTGISFANSSDELVDGPAYVGVNATNASLAGLNSSITRLSQVGAYRLTLECEAVSPEFFGALEMGEYTTEVTTNFNTSSGMLYYWGYYPGVLSSLQTGMTDHYYFAAYPLVSAAHVYLGILTKYTYSSQRMNSSYGNVVPHHYNLTSSGFKGTDAIMQSWGLNCTLFRQQGTVDLIRDNQNWRRENSSFSEEKKLVQMLISDWQVALAYTAPGSTNPGLAPALSGGNSLDLDTYASNYLYAAAETERMAYEVAASNQSRAQRYTVDAVLQRQFYRITYVPVILLAALILLCIASSIVVILVWYSRQSMDALQGRLVDPLRLMSDAVALHELHDQPEHDWSMSKLEEWSSKLRVRYHVSTDAVKLAPV